MRILWLTEFFPATDQGEITGGVESRCFFVSKYLRRQGYEVSIIARKTSGAVWHPPSLSSLPERLIFTLKAFQKGMESDFDLIEGTNSATYPVAWLLGTLKRKPIIYWYPDVFQGTWTKKFGLVGVLGDLSDWLLFHLPGARYLAISQSTKDKLVAKGVAKDTIGVLYCGVDPEEIKPINNLKISRKFDLCAVSRLLSYKRLDDLIKAVAVLRKKKPAIKLVIVGQGPEKGHLQDLVVKLGLEKNISFQGYLQSRQQLLATIKSAKILAHPSIVEGFGIVIIEAAALKVPFVASDIPVIAEVTRNGLGGELFKPESVSDLASKLHLLLENRSLYRRKSKEAEKLAQLYSWPDIAQKTAQVYESLLSH